MLTPKGLESRRRIVSGAATEVRARGVDEVRLEDVMARTKISKSQLFQGGVLLMLATGNLYHLEAALDLGIAILRHSAHSPAMPPQPENAPPEHSRKTGVEAARPGQVV